MGGARHRSVPFCHQQERDIATRSSISTMYMLKVLLSFTLIWGIVKALFKQQKERVKDAQEQYVHIARVAVHAHT